LDALVGGGWPLYGVVAVVGAPGTGKTVLAQQAVFSAARAGRPALYFSGISEPHDQLIQNMRGFAFFDESVLASQVQFLSLASALEEGGDAVEQVVQTARRSRAGLVVVDGYYGLRILMESDRQSAAFLYRLSTQISIIGARLMVVLEADPESGLFATELPMAGVILALSHDNTNPSGRRDLRVLKRRGAHPLPGLHAFTIDTRGITCYPQLESTIQPPRVPFRPSERAPLDLPALDEMLGGGLTAQSMTVVAGSVGTGKTSLGLQFLAAGVSRGEPGLFLGFHETYEQLLAKAAGIGFDLAGAEAAGLVQLMVQPPVALDADILAHILQQRISSQGTRRLVVDSVADLEALVPPSRAHVFLAAVVALLRRDQVTAVLTKETAQPFSADVDFGDLPVSVLAENILLLRQVPTAGEIRRVLAVVKMRFSDYDRQIREFTIGDQGLTVLGRWVGPLGIGPGTMGVPAPPAAEAGGGAPAVS
jgi:circadian clock protein KaiC